MKNDYIRDTLQRNNFSVKDVYKLWEDYQSVTNSNCTYASYKAMVRAEYQMIMDSVDNEEIEVIEKLKRISKQKQRLQDETRIFRKLEREEFRVFNAVEEYSQRIIDLLAQNDLSKFKIKKEKIINSDNYGIVHLSDLHLNELVNGLDTNNLYDFNIAAKRLKKFSIRAKQIFKGYGINNILIACTGDILNSSRRLDELLNQSTNRAKATILSVYLLEQFILDLSEDFDINIATVTGNESRLNEFNEFSEIMITDNFDWSIHHILKMLFKNFIDINFIEGDFKEKVISINEQNILLIHGESIKGNIDKTIQNIIGKYSEKGIIIRFILCGHIHSTNISDYHGRSASLVGSNAYSDKALNLYGRASQNIYIMDKSGSIDRIAIDLQDINNIKGYDIIKKLEAYNAKSATKLHENKTIMQIVI